MAGYYLACDIETGPLPDEQLLLIFRQPKPPEFDESAVRYGNAKRPEKRAEILEAAKAEHRRIVDDWPNEIDRQFEEFKSRAALSAHTGRVVAIGYQASQTGQSAIVGLGDGRESIGITEPDILAQFWAKFDACRRRKRPIVGHNFRSFDVPFLIRRSWICDVAIPDGVFDVWKGRINLSDWFVDTMTRWQLGVYGDKWISLNDLSVAMGVGAKPDEEECTGADFARLWLSGDEGQKERAKRYLLNDLAMTAAVADRTGL